MKKINWKAKVFPKEKNLELYSKRGFETKRIQIIIPGNRRQLGYIKNRITGETIEFNL